MDSFLDKLTNFMDKYEKFFPATKLVDGDLNKMLVTIFGYIIAEVLVIGIGFLLGTILPVLGIIWIAVDVLVGIYALAGIIYAIMNYVNRYNF